MLLEALRLLVAALLLVALPGWLLAQALFPRPSQLRPAERVYLTIGGGILLLMLVASILGFLPHGDRGHLQSFATRGMPNIELAMIATCLGLFWAGAHRGAYPRLAARYPRLVAPWNAPKAATATGERP